MRKFDTKVQYLKYKVLREVARHAWNDTLLESVLDIPKTIVPGKVPTMRCCVYKERAILAERVKLAMGGEQGSNIIQVIDIACDDCPACGATDGEAPATLGIQAASGSPWPNPDPSTLSMVSRRRTRRARILAFLAPTMPKIPLLASCRISISSCSRRASK